jgi:DNA-directed RNA polymerase subunit RPC12/RpoP
MGDRWTIEVTCPRCGYVEDGVPFAPTCGFTTWRCHDCGKKVDLCKHMGICAADTSNAAQIMGIMDGIRGR